MASSRNPCSNVRPKPRYAAFWGFSPSPRSTAWPEAQWEWLIEQQMFLFIGLSPQLLQQIVIHSENTWNLDRLNDQIIDCAKSAAGQIADLAEGLELFRPHSAALRIGVRHFTAGDPFSAASVLYPAVEGILRRHYTSRNSENYPRQARLIEDAKRTALAGRHAYCLLLIERFDAYLRQVIFADFDWKNPSGVSRHTIGHGVVEPDQCDEVSVARILLTIQHLLFSLNPPAIDLPISTTIGDSGAST